MRVQLDGQTIRLRLQDAEFEALLGGDAVENRTTLPDGTLSLQRVRTGPEAGLHAHQGQWQFVLPTEALHAYRQRLPTRDGLHFTLGEGDTALDLHFDVDVRDHVRRHPPHTPRNAG